MKKILSILGCAIFLATAYGAGVGGSACLATPGCWNGSNNMSYYGLPYGGRPIYYYPTLPYHSVYGPTNYYFRPFPPSPYQPTECVECMMYYNQFNNPGMFNNGNGAAT